MADDKTIEIRITAKNMSDAELAKARQAIAGFKRDAEGAKTSTLGFGQSLRGASSLAGAFGVTLGVGAVVKFGQALLDDADALVKLADKTGMSTDAVQRLKYIAEQSGNTLEQVTLAVSMLQKRLGQGDDSAVGALKSLGIEVDRFQQLDPEAQFMAIAREVAKIEDPTLRAAKATELFGRSGTEVLPSLIAKVDELANKAPVMSEKAVQAFDAIGDGLSDLWARTKNAVGEGLATMFDGFGRLASGMKALFSGDASRALEIFTDLANQKLPEVANSANLVHPPLKAIALSTKEVEAIETKLDATRKRSMESAKRYAAEQEKVAAALERIGFTSRKAVTDELALYEAMLKQQPTIAGVTAVQLAYLDQLEELAVRARRSSLEVPKLTTALEEARAAAARDRDAFIALEQSIPIIPVTEFFGAMTLQTEAVDMQAAKARDLTEAYHAFGQQTPDELRKVADASARNYDILVQSGTASTAQLTEAYAKMIADQRAVTGELPQAWTSSVVPGIKSALSTLQTAVSGTFAQMMLGAKGFKDGFLDIWSSLKASITRIFAEIADAFVSGLIKRMLASLAGNKQAFAGGFSGLFTGIAGGGGAGGSAAGMAASLLGGRGAMPGASGSLIGPEAGTGQMLMTGTGGGTNWGAIAGGGMMAIGGAVGLYQSLQSGSKSGAALSGASMGAGIGTMIAPGVGTAIGAGLGAIGGFAASLFGGNSAGRQADQDATAQIKALQAELLSTHGSLDRIRELGHQVGVDLAGAWGDQSRAGLEHFQGLLEQFNTKLATTSLLQAELAGLEQQLADRQVLNWQTADELVTKYGGTLGNLGPQFEAAKQQASFKTVLDDYQRLVDMGGDVGGSLFIMKEEIGALVGESLRIGTEIPAQFQPLVEELARTHQLFDDTGTEITDLSKLKFGGPLESESDTIKTAIMELVEALKGHLLPTIASIPRKLTIETGYTYEPYEPPGVDGGSPGGHDAETYPGYATGALITSEHVARVGEGGARELIGPVGFMAEALAGALASLGLTRASAAHAPEPAALAFAGMPAPVFTINIQALEPSGLKRVVEQEIAPLLVSIYRRNVNGLRTDTRRELVE